MGMFGCSITDNLDSSEFSKPMPWIGIYVAAASLAISIAMAVDAFHGFRYRKFWFPSRFASLNATSLTLIAVVIKLSVDLNTAMPQRQDQLAKLSSSVLVCTVMGNSMPSIGTMENKEIAMNIMALGILVITLVVNICIQLATGAIYIYWKEHVFIMFLMLVLLVILGFSALIVPTTKNYFELKYSRKYELAMKQGLNEVGQSAVVKLRDDLMKYWVMAHTCCPQFVVGRSVTCTASGAMCLLAAVTLAEALLRTYMMPWSFRFCSGESDYKWSTTLALVTQTIAVGVGTIAPTFRWFIAINFRCPNRGKKSFKDEFKVESYWTHKLVELKDCPLTIQIHGRYCRKLAHDLKTQILGLCIGLQTGIVLGSKLIRLISIYFMCQFFLCIHYCKAVKRKIKSKNISFNDDSGLESQAGPKLDLSQYVLRLEGEEELVELILKNNCNATDHWIQMGKMRQPKHLIQLLEKSTQGFKGLAEFDSGPVPSLDSEEPPNCWALPVVTLTSIAIALPNVDRCRTKRLIHSVTEGLIFVRIIENNTDAKGDFINIRNAAEIVWLGVDLYQKWLDVNLQKKASQAKSATEMLEELSNIAQKIFLESKSRDMFGCLKDTPLKWPVKVLAANSMYRVSKSVLLHCKSSNNQTSERLFEALSIMISDIFGACFTNLPQVICMKCFHSSIERREESVRQAICLLGRTEKILEILEQKALPILNPDQMASIDEWRLSCKWNSPLAFHSSSTRDTSTRASSDLYLPVE